MQTDIDPRDLIGHKAVDRNGDKIGTVDEVYLDDATGEPEWAAVRTGIFGRDAFVPLTTSEFSGEELKVPYDKSLIKESPDFGVGQHLSPAQELQLYRYYGLDTSGPGRPAAREGGAEGSDNGSVNARVQGFDFGAVALPGTRPVEHVDEKTRHDRGDAPAAAVKNVRQLIQPSAALHAAAARANGADPAADGAPSGPVEITCREERLDISTEWRVLGTARLRKYVTSEAVERRVPVVRERVRVERVPVNEAERAALSEQEIAEAVEEVTLREEHPVIRKYLAPIERVRLVVERYTEEELVHEELRREHVEVHDSTVRPPYGHQDPGADGDGLNGADGRGVPAAEHAGLAGHARPQTSGPQLSGPQPSRPQQSGPQQSGPMAAPLAARSAGPVRPEPLRPS